ncbi:MAG TPA: DUF938 domain-containing protein [Burkholderiaceae bacterium]
MPELGVSALASSPACLRNRDPILAQLQRLFADRTHVLEIGSGTGEHAVYFSGALSHLTWQTSDMPAYHATLRARLQAEGPANCLPPAAFDVEQDVWPGGPIDAVFTANTCHIMPWSAVQAMFAQFGAHLPAGARVCIYGPFNYGGRFSSDSNAAFDADLRARAAHMGIRDIEAMRELAGAAGLVLEEDVAMPANNRLLVFRRAQAA